MSEMPPAQHDLQEADASALYLPVPVAEPLVAEHRLRWDPAAADGVPAHVTILFPFLDPARIDETVRAELRAIAAAVPRFTLRFERVGRFPDVVWLAPEPVAPVAALTDAVVARWPDHPPYGGVFEVVVHHLTVADGAPEPVLDELERLLPAGLPLAQWVTELHLATRRAGAWSVDERLPLG